MTAGTLALWCDDFDADLLAVVPYVEEALGDTADVQLVTYSHETNGKINCPSAWWTDHGLTAFFATKGYGGPAPAGYWTDKKIVECTFLEAVRDEWIHHAAIVVNGRLIWKPPVRLMDDLMADLRGWAPLDEEKRREIQAHVFLSLAASAGRLRSALARLDSGADERQTVGAACNHDWVREHGTSASYCARCGAGPVEGIPLCRCGHLHAADADYEDAGCRVCECVAWEDPAGADEPDGGEAK